MNLLPLPPGSVPIDASSAGTGWLGIAFMVIVLAVAIWRSDRWHWFQALVALAVAALFIAASQETGVSFNQMSIAAAALLAAYGATVGLSWLLTRLRQRRLPDE